MYISLRTDLRRQFRRYSSGSRWILPKCIKDIAQNPPQIGDKIKLNGWVKSLRISKNVAFVDLVDGSSHGDIKCVVRPPSLIPKALNTGAGVQISGVWTEGKGKQNFELQVTEQPESQIQVYGGVEELYPLQKKTHSSQFLRSIPEYRWRVPEAGSILRMSSKLESSFSEFFHEHSFYKTHPPIVTSSDCEGAGELFRIESDSKLGSQEQFFGKKAYMTVSTQLHLEVLCAALGRVWTLTPCFRAEESDTNRHLSEFWMLEAEIAFIDDVSQLTRFSEEMLRYVARTLQNSGFDEFSEETKQRWDMLANGTYTQITYSEAIDLVRQNSTIFKTVPTWGDSLGSEHEKWLAGEYYKGPVFVTNYPEDQKPFYMKKNNDGKTVACYDLLIPQIGELIGGSLREHDLQKLEQEIANRQMDIGPLQWYLNLRKNGSVPHGGFGMGFERLLQYMSGAENIRDTIPFPRTTNHCAC
ncbi:hypothetical protein KL938_002420 [Ogataea parapolymorpha]|nr:hypothetical protein KL938_002420 [Ogataea parapolymorpha]